MSTAYNFSSCSWWTKYTHWIKSSWLHMPLESERKKKKTVWNVDCKCFNRYEIPSNYYSNSVCFNCCMLSPTILTFSTTFWQREWAGGTWSQGWKFKHHPYNYYYYYNFYYDYCYCHYYHYYSLYTTTTTCTSAVTTAALWQSGWSPDLLLISLSEKCFAYFQSSYIRMLDWLIDYTCGSVHIHSVLRLSGSLRG